MLIVAGEQGEVRPTTVRPRIPAVADGRPDAAAYVVADDEGGTVGPGLVAGAVGRAVVDDDRLEAPVAGQLVEDAADLAGLVEGRDDDGDDRFGMFGRGRGQRDLTGRCRFGFSPYLAERGAPEQRTDGTGGAQRSAE